MGEIKLWDITELVRKVLRIVALVFILFIAVRYGGKMADSKELKQALFAKQRISLLPKVEEAVGRIRPFLAQAIKQAEGNPRNFGVLSVPTANKEEAEQVLNNSIRNSIIRWVQAKQPIPFSEFMQKRWAPIGATNDPKGLNKNWLGNVEGALLQYLGEEEYDKWRRAKMVR